MSRSYGTPMNPIKLQIKLPPLYTCGVEDSTDPADAIFQVSG